MLYACSAACALMFARGRYRSCAVAHRRILCPRKRDVYLSNLSRTKTKRSPSRAGLAKGMVRRDRMIQSQLVENMHR